MVIIFMPLCYIPGMFGKKAGERTWSYLSSSKRMRKFSILLVIAEVDRCGMVQPYALIQQHSDYGHW